MNRSDLISKVLCVYKAFYEQYPCATYAHNSRQITTCFQWKRDTPFAFMPLFDEEDYLYDYSSVLSKEVNKDTYKEALLDPLSGVAKHNVRKINEATAKEIMQHNMEAMTRVVALQEKAFKLKEIMEE